MNGSGKSNILDAICFVLGITNLSQVRAGNLSELVYKQGQAGVNKAVVTIVFNNEDTANSPVGFEQCLEVTVTRQVLLGGKSKYLINARNAPASAVQNLFHSVQLNVNNPHFLIMQGRITKVLNMKAHEILGMVEEAAGTRMYETKRVAALKTIEKKQAKLDEINAVLEEEITPTLERLRGEKQNYLKWSKNSADLERYNRFCIAHQFQMAQVALTQNAEGVSDMENKVIQLDSDAKKYQEHIIAKEEEISTSSCKLKGEMDSRLAKTKKVEQGRSNELVRITSIWKNCLENVTKAESELETAKQMVEETKNAVAVKENEIEDETAAAKETVESAAKAETEYERLTVEYQTMSAGISATTESRTLPEQISQAHADSKIAESKVAQARLKLTHLSKELKVRSDVRHIASPCICCSHSFSTLQSVEQELKKEGKSAEKLASKKKASTNKVADIKAELSKLDFTETEYESFEQQKTDLESAVTELSERVDTLQAQLNGRLGFQYSDPVRGFDRSKVKGLVAKLIEVKDSKHATALEVVAGGKLFQVVVDEAITGKALLDRGKLQKRITIIPLDKIKPRHVGANATQHAEAIAHSLKSTATSAIELVGFDEEVRSAIEYVFGSSIVVDGIKAANQICDVTKTRTVTLDGDVYDPSGTISGGSNNQLGTTLVRLTELAKATQELQEKKPLLDHLYNKIKALKAVSASYDKLTAQLEVAQAELEAADKHLSQTNFGMLVEKRDFFIAGLKAAEDEVVMMTEEKENKWNLYQNLQDKETELTKLREERLSDFEQAVKDAKVTAAKTSKLAREAKSRSQTLVLELDSLKGEVVSAEEVARAAQKALDDAMNDESESQMLVGDIQSSYEEARQDLEMLEASVAECSAEISDLKRAKANLVKLAEAAKLESKKISLNIASIRKDRAAAEKVVGVMLKKHVWIESEKSAFGIRGGDYDFEAANPEEVSEHLKELKNEQESLVRFPSLLCHLLPYFVADIFVVPRKHSRKRLIRR